MNLTKQLEMALNESMNEKKDKLDKSKKLHGLLMDAVSAMNGKVQGDARAEKVASTLAKNLDAPENLKGVADKYMKRIGKGKEATLMQDLKKFRDEVHAFITSGGTDVDEGSMNNTDTLPKKGVGIIEAGNIKEIEITMAEAQFSKHEGKKFKDVKEADKFFSGFDVPDAGYDKVFLNITMKDGEEKKMRYDHSKKGGSFSEQLKSHKISEAGGIDDEFVDYFNSFYGPEGIYKKANKVKREYTKEELEKALAKRDKERKIPFEGDSMDRETLRDRLADMKLLSLDY